MCNALIVPLFTFESTDVGACPFGWTCTGEAEKVMNGGGASFIGFGGESDNGVGTATSAAFVLPNGIDRVVLSRAGGADGESGFRIKASADDSELCRAHNGADTNTFFDDQCEGLSAHGGKSVYILIEDRTTSGWGKVWVNNIRFQNEAGGSLTICEFKRAVLFVPLHILSIASVPFLHSPY